MYFSIDELNESQLKRYVHVENIMIFTEHFVEIKNAIKHEHQRAKLNNYEKKPRNILISGPSGAGKSAIVEWYRDKHPRWVETTETEEVSKVPVLYISLPDDKNPRAAPRAILKSLGVPDRKSSETRAELNASFRYFAKECGVEVIIIDEIHNAFKAGTSGEVVRVATWLKTLINDTKIPLVLVGLQKECETLIKMESELETRFSLRFNLNFYSQETFSEWLSVLDSLDEKLPFEELSNLADGETGLRLLLASEGRFSYLMDRIIRPAAQLAIYENTPHMTMLQMFTVSKNELGFPLEKHPLNELKVPLSKLIRKNKSVKNDEIKLSKIEQNQGVKYSTGGNTL